MTKLIHLLLAAGASTRMHEPKQLLSWGNQTLLEFQIHKLLETGLDIMVVLGANAEKIKSVIEHLPIKVCVNKTWKKGMGSSIAYGCAQILEEYPDTEGILISLVDQPLVSAAYFSQLIASFKNNANNVIASSTNAGWNGVPALFGSIYFDKLLQLSGEEGAKQIILHAPHVSYIDAGNMLVDMDTYESYQELYKTYFSNDSL